MLLRDIERGRDKQLAIVAQIVARIAPDILLITDFDLDHGGVTLAAFAAYLADRGVEYPYSFARMGNAGISSGHDLDGDGQTGGPGDAWGFGRFPGAQSMALLSRLPIERAGARDFSTYPWASLPGSGVPPDLARLEPPVRLSYRAHWDIPVTLPSGGAVHILAAHASPPVFDGPDNVNGRRNRDEVRFWSLYLDGALAGLAPPPPRFVILGDLNADPLDGEGDKAAINGLVDHPRLQDPHPASRGAVVASEEQGGGNRYQSGAPSLDTVNWDEGRTGGNMRVDYVLPSANLTVIGAGVFWPAPDEDGFELVGRDGGTGSHHRLVWVDIALDG